MAVVSTVMSALALYDDDTRQAAMPLPKDDSSPVTMIRTPKSMTASAPSQPAKTQEIKIRRARKSDVDRVVPLMYASGPHEFDWFLNANEYKAEDFIRFAFQRPGQMFSYQWTYVAEDEKGNVIGTYNLANRGDYKRSLPKLLRLCLKFYGTRYGCKVIHNGLRLSNTVLGDPQKNVLYLAMLGVSEEARGLGVGTQMIAFAKALAREEGYAALEFDVADTNTRAKDLYIRLGMREVLYKPSPLENVPGQYLLSCDTTSALV